MSDSRPEDAVSEAARKLLLARAERLREKPVEEETSVYWAAEFPLGGEAYALPLDSLVACEPLRLVTPVPLSDPTLTGVVRFQRRLLSVVSLAGTLGTQGWRRDPSVLLVLKLHGDRLAAVDCEEIPRALSLPLKTVEEARRADPSGPVLSVERPGLEPLRLIDIERLFPGQLLKTAEKKHD